MTVAVPPRLARALGLSLLAHALVLAAGGRFGPATPATLAAFAPIEVTLAGAHAVRFEPRRPPAATSAAASASAPASPEHNATGSGSETDTPLVEARADVAALNNPRPPYPLAARRRGLEGRVLLAVHVRADGSCAEVQLRQSSGHALLDDSALGTVRRWRFLPATRSGQAIDSWVDVPVSFRLNG